jgi:hypothetical protein
MSAVLARRLRRLERAAEPETLGHYHCIYARNAADFERQKADLIASDRAKASDLIIDANWQSWQQRGWSADAPEYVGNVRESETHAWTRPWIEYIHEWDRERTAR